MSSSHRGHHRRIKYTNQVKRAPKRPWAIISGAAVLFKALVVAVPVLLILESIGIVDLTRIHAYTNPYTQPHTQALKDRWSDLWGREAVAVAEPIAVVEAPVVEVVSAVQEEMVLASEPAVPIIEAVVEPVVELKAVDSSPDDAVVVSYRATFFSDPTSVGAAERPISRGTHVQIVQRQGDWVKVQTVDSQEIGFIHQSHLQ